MVLSDDWGRWPSSSQHLFRHLALDRAVLWVETFGMRLPRPSVADVRRTVEKVRAWAGADVAAPWVEPPPRLTRFAPPVPPRPEAALAAAVRRKMDELGIVAPHLLVSVPVGAGVVGRLGEESATCYRVDDFALWPGYAHKLVAERERTLLERAGGLVFPGPQLDVPSFGGRRLLLPHGVDVARFADPGPRPAALPADGRPVHLFAGKIDERVDFGLLAGLDGHVVALGRATVPVPDPVVHLPEVPWAELPAWLAAADTLLLPYARSPWTDSLSPLKLPEYLASGTPVISTSLPDLVRIAGGRPGVAFADTPAAFAEAARRAAVAAPALPSAAVPAWDEQAARLVAFVSS